MPTSKYFDRCPKFPSDAPVADLAVISLQKLRENDGGETEILYEACREQGFFLLDLQGSKEGQRLLKDAERMYDLASEVFELDEEILDQYPFSAPKSLIGYKRAGKLPTEDGGRDAVEMYSIGQDDMLGNETRRENPKPIEARRSECKEFCWHAHEVLSVILSQLDMQLGLPAGTFEALCSLNKPSDANVRLILNRPQPVVEDRRVTLGAHTDIGALTMLFHVVGGLQILPAGSENSTENWRYIRPERGCCLVNLGDAMVQWTGGILRSGLHRVVKAPGEQSKVPRQSIGYFLRPSYDGSMARIKHSEVIPPLTEDEEDEKRSPAEWAAALTIAVMKGEYKPQTIGGRAISIGRSPKVVS